MTNKHLVGILIITAFLTPTLGCDSEASQPTVESELRDMVGTYMHALQANDAPTVESLMSDELRSRIETRGPNADFASNLQLFVSRERDKLIRSVQTSDAVLKPFTVVSSGILADGSVAYIEIIIDEASFPKPIYFTLTDGSYKLSVLPRNIVALEGNTYVVKNDDGVPRAFTCSGGGDTVAPGGTLSEFCNDSCGWFFDATRFTVNGSSADCDYNTWGVDMYIRNNSPVCADRC